MPRGSINLFMFGVLCSLACVLFVLVSVIIVVDLVRGDQFGYALLAMPTAISMAGVSYLGAVSSFFDWRTARRRQSSRHMQWPHPPGR